MPAFDDSATAAAPVEEVWKLLYDPARMVEWWEGIERVEPSGDGEITIYPDGYPDFPMPQELRTAADGRGLTISCLVSYLVYRVAARAARRRHPHQRARRDPRGGGAPPRGAARGSERVPALTRRAGHGYGLTSSTRLNGVSADRRTRLRPPSFSTSVRRCSPAWAPSASPTSWLSEAGVQSIVEPA